VYPHTHNNELAQAHQAELREEAAEHRLARQVRTARQLPPQGRGATIVPHLDTQMLGPHRGLALEVWRLEV
jgi:hypothetical protein